MVSSQCFLYGVDILGHGGEVVDAADGSVQREDGAARLTRDKLRGVCRAVDLGENGGDVLILQEGNDLLKLTGKMCIRDRSIRDSNAGQYDFHLALHSNAMPEASAGTARGVDIYYSPMSEAGLRMANIIVDNLRPIYPLPEKVRALSTVAIGEVRRTRAPAVLAELGYHAVSYTHLSEIN